MTDKRPCQSNPAAYDELHESSYTPQFKEAVEAARWMCGTCLLNSPDVARACLRENKGERWVAAVLGKRLPINKPAATDEKRIAAAKGKHVRANAARLEALRDLIASGAEIAEVLERLTVSRNALWKWCHKYGHSAEWEALAGKDRARENQYTKGRAA